VEIAALEQALSFGLPQAYKDYLLWMGKDHHGIFRGSGWFIGDLTGNRAVLSGLLEEVGSTCRLKPTEVVFFSHQGYMAAWFSAQTADPDPHCFYIDDGTQEPRATNTFSQVLLDDIRGLASALRP